MIVLTCVVLCYSRGVIIDGRLRHTARPYRTAAAQVQRFGSSQGTGQAQTAVVFFIFVPTGRLYHCINRQSNLIALGLVFYIDCNICFSTIKPLRGRADTHCVCAFVHGEGSVETERNGRVRKTNCFVRVMLKTDGETSKECGEKKTRLSP